MALINKLSAIADAIRGKTGKSDLLTLDGMVSEIKGLNVSEGDTLQSMITNTLSEYSNANVTRIGDYVFHDCTALTSIDFPSVTSVGNYAFEDCTGLITANFPELTNVGNSSFRRCNKLTTINVEKVTSISGYAFYECKALTEISVPLLVSFGSSAFEGCSNLVNVTAPLTTSIEKSAFRYCYDLASANFPLVSTMGSNAFEDCDLTHVNFPKVTSIQYNTFAYCSSLETVDTSSLTAIHRGALSNTSKLTALILRNTEAVCDLINVDALYNSGISRGTGYVYVPSALYDSYVIATNWSTYSAQIRKLEDYTVDGTVTGELDTSKTNAIA